MPAQGAAPQPSLVSTGRIARPLLVVSTHQHVLLLDILIQSQYMPKASLCEYRLPVESNNQMYEGSLMKQQHPSD